MNYAVISTFQLSRRAAQVVLSAADLTAAVEIWRELKKGLFDPYRPELHYMRGPGPKWHETHSHADSSRSMPSRNCVSRKTSARRKFRHYRDTSC
jgi:hypothetical protein